jgi:hypothetical protein
MSTEYGGIVKMHFGEMKMFFFSTAPFTFYATYETIFNV